MSRLAKSAIKHLQKRSYHALGGHPELTIERRQNFQENMTPNDLMRLNRHLQGSNILLSKELQPSEQPLKATFLTGGNYEPQKSYLRELYLSEKTGTTHAGFKANVLPEFANAEDNIDPYKVSEIGLRPWNITGTLFTLPFQAIGAQATLDDEITRQMNEIEHGKTKTIDPGLALFEIHIPKGTPSHIFKDKGLYREGIILPPNYEFTVRDIRRTYFNEQPIEHYEIAMQPKRPTKVKSPSKRKGILGKWLI